MTLDAILFILLHSAFNIQNQSDHLMQKESTQNHQKIPTQMIVQYTKLCIQNQLHKKLPLDVRNFIERIENWDLHYPNSEIWTGQRSLYQKERDFIQSVVKLGVFDLIKATKIKTLFLFEHRFEGKSLLTSIIQPAYERLKWLSLTENQIYNIQAIVFLEAPLLERLDLNRNNISISKALNKTNFKSLNRLNIQTNPIKLLDLSRGCWAVQIESFHIEGKKDSYVNDQRYEYSGPIEWIFKLNSQKANNINTRWSARIKQLHLLPLISQRFNQDKPDWPIFNN